MRDWLDFGTCFEVDDERIEHALAPAASIEEELPRARVFALLDRMAEVARPRQGAPRILFVLARLASCEWLEGDLEVTLRAEGNDTIVDLTVDDGMNLNRLRPSLTLSVPFHEFETSVERITDFLEPLKVAERVEGQSIALSVEGAAMAPEDAKADRITARPPVDIGAVGMDNLARRSDRPQPKEEPSGWGRRPDPKSTVKMKAVRIPIEAYRDPPAPFAPARNASTGTDDTTTVQPDALTSQPDEDAGSTPTDDIDVEW